MRRLKQIFARRSVLVRHEDFRRLFAAKAVSSFGDGLLPVALVFGVMEAGGGASDIGFVLAAGLLPTAVVALAGGVWADRLPRRALLISTDLTQWIVHSVSAVLLISGTVEVWHLATLQFAAGVARAVFYPAVAGVIPHTVPKEDLQQANATLSVAQDTCMLLGPMVAGGIVAAAGAGVAIGVNALTFLLSLWFVARLSVGRRVANFEADDAPPARMLRDLRDGWELIAERKWILTELVRSTFDFPIVVAPFLILGPVIAASKLGGASAWALISAAFFGGTLLGAIIAAGYRPRRPMLLGTSLMYLTAIPPVALAFSESAILIAGVELVRGVAVGFFGAVWATLLQSEIPDAARSRVNAWDVALSRGLTPLGFVVAAPLAAWLGDTNVLLLSAGFAVCSVSLALMVPQVRGLVVPENPALEARRAEVGA